MQPSGRHLWVRLLSPLGLKWTHNDQLLSDLTVVLPFGLDLVSPLKPNLTWSPRQKVNRRSPLRGISSSSGGGTAIPIPKINFTGVCRLIRTWGWGAMLPDATAYGRSIFTLPTAFRSLLRHIGGEALFSNSPCTKATRIALIVCSLRVCIPGHPLEKEVLLWSGG